LGLRHTPVGASQSPILPVSGGGAGVWGRASAIRATAAVPGHHPRGERGVADRLRGAAGVLGLVNSAVVNGLNSAEAFRLSRMGPQELAISIADSHPHLRGISDAELMDALSRFLRT
jgi:hypothetical protein